MIYISGERIDTLNGFKEDYLKWMSEASKRKQPFVFKYYKMFNFDTTEKGNVIRNRRVYNIPYTQMWNGYEVSFFDPSKHRFEVNAGGIKRMEGRLSYISMGDINLNPSNVLDREFAYFLIKFSSQYRNGEITLYSPERIASNQAKKEELLAYVHSLIFSKDSVISREYTGSETFMRNIARKWGIMNTEKITYDQVRVALWNKLQTMREDTKIKQYEIFLNDIKEIKNVNLIANIRLAIEKGLLEYNSFDGYYYLYSRTGVKNKILKVNKNEMDKATDLLFNFFANNLIWQEVLITTLSASNDNSKTSPDITPIKKELSKKFVITEDTKYGDIVEYCKLNGINTKTPKGGRRSKEELIEEIQKKLGK